MTGTSRTPSSARDVRDSKAVEVGMRVGLASYGAMHLLFAFIALQLAWTNDSTSSQGAISQLAQETWGQVLLWVAGLGLVALALWQGVEAAAGYSGFEDKDRLKKRVKSAARTVVYLMLAWLAISNAAGLSGGGSSKDGLTAQLMSVTAGRFLVGLIGLVVIGVGVMHVRKGVKKKFTEDLDGQATSGQSGRTLLKLGQVGWIAKGVSVAMIGALFTWAAISYDPQKAGGLDQALRVLLQQPYGAFLLSLMGLGLVAFGVYCFGWAKNPRT